MRLSLPQWKMSSTKLILLVSLYFTVALNIAFFRKVLELQPFSGTSMDYFLYTLPLVYFCAINIILTVLSLPFVHKVIVPLLIVISAAISYNSLFFNVYFDVDMLTNVLETDAAESSRLLTVPYLCWVFFLGIVPAVLYCLVKIEYKTWWKELLYRVGAILVFALAILGVARFFYQDYASFFRNNKSLHYLITPSNFVESAIKKVRHYYRDNTPYMEQGLDAKLSKSDRKRNVTVIVLGETTRAQNWGLNGYTRQTTPKLAARGDEIINFKDVNSCGTATATSVPCIFSTLTRSEFKGTKAAKQDNLLDMLQRAGVEILWLNNNSSCKGVCQNTPNINVMLLDLPEFCRNDVCLDNALLGELDKALEKPSDKDLLVVLHTMGSHGPTYFERYTDKEKVFTPTCDTNEINRCSNEQLSNTYDNTIVYADQLIDQVITRMEKHPEWKSAVAYLADHGESLGEDGIYLHGTPYAIAPEYQTKVPMVFWFSPTWKENKPYDMTCLRNNAASKTYSHDNFFHSMVAVSDLDLGLSVYNKDLDILSECKK